jgi:uncharacterized protein (DUF4415 family)
MYMDKTKIIIMGIILVLVLAVGGVFLFTRGADPAAKERESILALARDYLNKAEYQRSLDLLEKLLIANPKDAEAAALMDEVFRAKKAMDEKIRQEELAAQEARSRELEKTLGSMKTPSGPSADDIARAMEKERLKAQKEAREREEQERKAEEERLARLSAEQRARQEKIKGFIRQGDDAMKIPNYPLARTRYEDALDLDKKQAIPNARIAESYFRENPNNAASRKQALHYANEAIKIDADVLAWFKSSGRGYQTRINKALREVMVQSIQ